MQQGVRAVAKYVQAFFDTFDNRFAQGGNVGTVDLAGNSSYVFPLIPGS